ncbi:MAG: hypothetical protein V3T60_10555 [Candidatus Binatia bacterium]
MAMGRIRSTVPQVGMGEEKYVSLINAIERLPVLSTEIMKGNPQPFKNFFSAIDDVFLRGALGGPPAIGRKAVEARLDWTADRDKGFADGVTDYKHIRCDVSENLVSLVSLEIGRVRSAGQADFEDFHVLSIHNIRFEGGEWKLSMRVAYRLDSAQDTEAIMQLVSGTARNPGE